MKSKEALLKELERMGIDTTKKVRKPRSDVGSMRGEYKPRSDKGKARSIYTNTAAKYRSIYEKMLNTHKSSTQDGADTITRDHNDIFPPNINRRYRKYISKDREYTASIVIPAHLEQARWRWLMAEFQEDPDKWRDHISKWYFIKPDEIEMWMYTEWAWAYVFFIDGQENRLVEHPLILSYSDYLDGNYNGFPQFDEKGEIIWRKNQD